MDILKQLEREKEKISKAAAKQMADGNMEFERWLLASKKMMELRSDFIAILWRLDPDGIGRYNHNELNNLSVAESEIIFDKAHEVFENTADKVAKLVYEKYMAAKEVSNQLYDAANEKLTKMKKNNKK